MKALPRCTALVVMLTLGGCTLPNGPATTDQNPMASCEEDGSQWIFPKQCAIRMAILSRPEQDKVLRETLWSVADSQVVEDKTRLMLHANGLRVGRVTGELPPEVTEIMNAPPPHRVDPATVILPDGDSTLVNLEASAEELTLLLAMGERASVQGKRFQDVGGFLRLRASRGEEDSVSLRVMPEFHHGAVRQGWSVASGGGALDPKQLVTHEGPTEETFQDLAVSLTLRPGQVAILSSQPERKGSLGDFLFGGMEPESDRRMVKVLLVWASQYTPEVNRAKLAARDGSGGLVAQEEASRFANLSRMFAPERAKQ